VRKRRVGPGWSPYEQTQEGGKREGKGRRERRRRGEKK